MYSVEIELIYEEDDISYSEYFPYNGRGTVELWWKRAEELAEQVGEVGVRYHSVNNVSFGILEHGKRARTDDVRAIIAGRLDSGLPASHFTPVHVREWLK